MKISMKNDIKVNKSILNLYLFLFIFTMMNREFQPFGIDLRYLLILIGAQLIISILYRNKLINNFSFLEKLLITFGIITILSNVSWFFNGLNIGRDFISYNILFIYNIMTILVVILYKKDIDVNNIVKYILISGLTLFISMILILFGVKMNQIMGGSYSGIFIGGEHFNFFGGDFRLAGYAQDCNYASMFMIIIGATALYFINNKVVKYLFLAMSIIGFMLSASKTLIIGLVVAIVLVMVQASKNYKISRCYNPLKNIFILAIAIGPYIAMKIIDALNISMGLHTMNLRLVMWENAVNLFEKSPIIGSGLTSYRSFLMSVFGDWYVQSHSTIFQVMSETGVIGLLLFSLIFYKILKYKNKYVIFIATNFLVFSLTYELNYLSLFAFVVAILPIVGDKYVEEKNIDKNKILYIINSLGNGGAERVVANSANKMAQEGLDVTILTIKDIVNYEFDENVKIVSLKEEENIGKLKKFLNIPINIIKINNIIAKLENESRFALITSHLPVTHVISRFLLCRDRILFVLHNPHYHLDKNNSILFKLLLRFQYNNNKLIAVSKGVEDELVIKYGVKTEYIKTIYNPINLDNILENVEEKLDVPYKYLLFCGRLTMQKRPDRLINAFYQGEFYKTYKLVLLGAGELHDDLVKQCEYLGISEHVVFAGWQNNVYKWMRNSEVMISTSDYESFGMNIVEALACSAKVVSVDCDFGPSEILTGEYSKYLVPIDNMDKLIETIQKAINYYPENRFDQITKFDCKNINDDYIQTSLQWINNV